MRIVAHKSEKLMHLNIKKNDFFCSAVDFI